MSTFEGITREYPGISIDRFDGKNLASTLYILSHFHSDHTVGLASEPFKERILSNPDLKVYCSETTRSLVLLEDCYAFLKDALVSLADDVPSELYVPTGKDDSSPIDSTHGPITLTLLPAGHCPGSAMCLIEGSGGRVLYTGDYRISADRFKLLKSLSDADGNPKTLDSLYVDTTFFHPSNTFIPSRSYSLLCATEVIGHWIDQGRTKIANLKFKASLGCEHLLSAIGKHFNMKIHVSDHKFKQCSNVGNLSDLFTTDPDSTQIHACDSIMPSVDLKKQKRKNHSSSKEPCRCRVLRDAEPEDLRTLTFSAMFFTGASTLDKYCIPVGRNHFKICYSLHPSYGEVCQLVEHLKPKRAFANVTKLGSKTPKSYDVQQELDRVVDRARTSNCRTTGDAGKEFERSLKRQFSEDSMDNFLFEETQSYLRSSSKRPRLEGYDLSADILGLKAEVSGDGTTDQSRKRKRNSSVEEEKEENPFQRWAKRISPERRALQEHLGRGGQNNDHETSHYRSTSDEDLDGLDEFDTDEENKLLDTSNSDPEDRVAAEEEGVVPDGPVEDCRAVGGCSPSAALESVDRLDDSCQISGRPEKSCHFVDRSEDSCRFVGRSDGPRENSTSPTKDHDALTINLCNDEDVPSEEEEAIKESRSDVLVDSDVTVELNSSIDAGAARPPIETEGFDTRLTSKCSAPTDSPPGTRDLESVDVLPSVGEPSTCEATEGQPGEGNCSNVPSGQRVVCIDLTEDVDEEDDDDDDEDEEDRPNVVHLPPRSRSKSDEDDDDDDRGYDGGDECDSSDFNNDHNEERAGNGSAAVAARLTAAGDEDDSNDRTSGYDSDTPHFTELQRKSYARFEKLYKRKQRKIKIKTRRQNLRNVAKDDVIVIDDDDTSETDDSYDYDSGDSSSDYDHYPGKGRGGKRSTDDTEQFLMPSMSSSSESSQTLSSEDNVVVVVNSRSQEEEEEEEEAQEEARKGREGPEKSEAPPTSLNQNGEHC